MSAAKHRTLRLAGMTAGVTGSYAGYVLQRIFLSGDALDRKRRRRRITSSSPAPRSASTRRCTG